MIWLQMFWEFFKAGLFAVGGGLATLPFLYDISQRTGWFTAEDIANMIAISESTPGPLGVNMATYAGFEALGIPGVTSTGLRVVLTSLNHTRVRHYSANHSAVFGVHHAALSDARVAIRLFSRSLESPSKVTSGGVVVPRCLSRWHTLQLPFAYLSAKCPRLHTSCRGWRVRSGHRSRTGHWMQMAYRMAWGRSVKSSRPMQ